MVELRLAKAGDDARLGRKFCETVACRIVTRPVANECAARNARLGEANPAGGDAFAEAAILVTDGASDRREIVERPEQIGDFRPMRGALGAVAPRRCDIGEMIAIRRPAPRRPGREPPRRGDEPGLAHHLPRPSHIGRTAHRRSWKKVLRTY